MPAVSVILPTCDRPHLVGRALASILNQTWTDWEVILVDSNRATPPLHTQAGLAPLLVDARIVVVREPHRPNAAAARNLGLQAARGEWITYLDDDDVFRPEKIAVQLARANESGAPLVLCGYTVVRPKRRRTRQVGVSEYRGDALLLEANWGTPMLFHRRDDRGRFDETLPVGHDEAFAHDFIARHGLTVVPNCPRSLVDVYPQPGARVHADFDEVWRTYRVTCRRVGARYSHRARRGYLAMGRLVRAQAGHGNWAHFAGCAGRIFCTRGPGAWRLVANATARRLGWFKDWLVI